ncbi:MAG: hypothetical protein KF878_19660 [Planctomycetes bacterium]|nr:hypothetical protein [Planctomycetota bacterium]
MSALAAVRALLERLQAGEALSEAELDALALEARALRRRLERLRAVAPEVEVELDPTLARLAERAVALPV